MKVSEIGYELNSLDVDFEKFGKKKRFEPPFFKKIISGFYFKQQKDAI